jgi:hypothetical protein
VPGDFNVDGLVNAADYLVLRKGIDTGGTTYTQGDADFDGDVDSMDWMVWQGEFGFVRQALMAGSGSGLAAVPEPETMMLASLMFSLFGLTTKTPRTPRRKSE